MPRAEFDFVAFVLALGTLDVHDLFLPRVDYGVLGHNEKDFPFRFGRGPG